MSISNSATGEASASFPDQSPTAPPASVVETKKKRRLPGMPDPGAEVIALSPETLMATNRFVCEICGKGFQRDQNLQLHRRGHNLPWKLRQRAGAEARKRVYVCPEEGCVHHDPSRALGDLTGIKKHFSRKHGEKKWKCDKCPKKYAVRSDWKAHSKTCGAREYRCGCGSLFSRRDSFISHRAFCGALALGSPIPRAVAADSGAAHEGRKKTTSAVVDVVLSTHPVRPLPPEEVEDEQKNRQQRQETEGTKNLAVPTPSKTGSVNDLHQSHRGTGSSSRTSWCADPLLSTSSSSMARQPTAFTDLVGSMTWATPTTEPTFLLSPRPHARPSAHMSATALLQKAARMGATSTTASLLGGLGLATSDAPASLSGHRQVEEPARSSCEDSGGGPAETMQGSTSVLERRTTTLDFLGVGMAPKPSAPAIGDGSPTEMIGMENSIKPKAGKSKKNTE